MSAQDVLAEQFEVHRGHLRAVAYRMLGSLTEADDAVQESWLRLHRSDPAAVDDMRAWLTTVTARICLDTLRRRKSRREEPLDVHVPDPVVSLGDVLDPESEALLADSLGMALLVVLDTLSPAERLAFVLHDMFGVPFEDIAKVVGRSSDATKQLASRARRRIQGVPTAAGADVARQRRVVDAFLAAARAGDFDALVAVLDPDVVLRADAGREGPGVTRVVRGAQTVARQALTFSALAPLARPVLVNGQPGLMALRDGKPISVLALTIVDDHVVEMNILADPARLEHLAPQPLRD